jgi:hypothetical protein
MAVFEAKVSTQIYMVRPYTVWKKYVYNFQSGSWFSLKTRVQFYVIRQQMKQKKKTRVQFYVIRVSTVSLPQWVQIYQQ